MLTAPNSPPPLRMPDPEGAPSVEAVAANGFAQRLGRNAMDLRATVEALTGMGVKVYCLALGGMDLTSPAGKMTMGVIAAVAEFERDLLIERTQAGLARAKAEGKVVGRPSTFTPAQAQEVLQKLSKGGSVASLARDYKTTRQTIMRVRDSVLR